MAGISECVYAANAVLNSAVKLRGAAVDKSFADVAVSARSKGAAVGHKVVKVLERDVTISYETERDILHKELGATIGQRMNSRIVKWGVGKWKLHEQHYENEIAEAFEILNTECHKPSSYLAGKPIRHVRNVF